MKRRRHQYGKGHAQHQHSGYEVPSVDLEDPYALPLLRRVPQYPLRGVRIEVMEGGKEGAKAVKVLRYVGGVYRMFDEGYGPS